jgi:hypothetical protein
MKRITKALAAGLFVAFFYQWGWTLTSSPTTPINSPNFSSAALCNASRNATVNMLENDHYPASDYFISACTQIS